MQTIATDVALCVSWQSVCWAHEWVVDLLVGYYNSGISYIQPLRLVVNLYISMLY